MNAIEWFVLVLDVLRWGWIAVAVITAAAAIAALYEFVIEEVNP